MASGAVGRVGSDEVVVKSEANERGGSMYADGDSVGCKLTRR